MEHALVTGGAGFIGAHLARVLLAQGARVTLIDNFQRGVRDSALCALEERGAILIDGDLRSEGWAEGLDRDFSHVYHLAAIVGVRHVLNRPYSVLTDNVRMLDRVIAVARSQSTLERFVFASTSEVYAGSISNLAAPVPTPENTALVLPPIDHPRTSYMLSKLYGEAMCAASGLPYTIVRPHNIYGPRMGLSHVIPELIQRALHKQDGETIDVYSVDHTRTFCYIDDAVALMLALAKSPGAANRSFNLGNSGPEIAIGELAEKLFAVLGKKLSIQPQPAAQGSPVRRCPDTSALDSATGIRERVPLEDGLRLTAGWYAQTVFTGGARSAD